MTNHVRLYKVLLFLYPSTFRRQHHVDLVQAFRDLGIDRGLRAAWARCGVDLIVTAPRYRLEVLMHRHVPQSAMTGLVAMVALTGLATVALGGLVGLPVLAAAAALGVAQRSDLARSLAVGRPQRRVLFGRSLVLAVVFASVLASWLYHVGRYDELGATTVLVHNAVGMLSVIGAIGFAMAGLLTRPRSAAARI